MRGTNTDPLPLSFLLGVHKSVDHYTQCCVSVQRLRKLDPDYAASIERNDWYRLKRALDICTLSGRSATLTLLNSHRMKNFYSFPRTVTSFKKEPNEDCEANTSFILSNSFLNSGFFFFLFLFNVVIPFFLSLPIPVPVSVSDDASQSPVPPHRLSLRAHCRPGTVPSEYRTMRTYSQSDLLLLCRQQEVISLVHSHGLVPDSPAGRSMGYRQALEWLRDTWGFPDSDRVEPYTLQVSIAYYHTVINTYYHTVINTYYHTVINSYTHTTTPSSTVTHILPHLHQHILPHRHQQLHTYYHTVINSYTHTTTPSSTVTHILPHRHRQLHTYYHTVIDSYTHTTTPSSTVTHRDQNAPYNQSHDSTVGTPSLGLYAHMYV